MAKEYKDLFSLDGRLAPELGVTPEKVAHTKTLVEQTLSGNRIAKGTLEQSLATSDAIFNLARRVNIGVLSQFEEEPRVWRQIAGTRLVSDFRPATLYTPVPDWKPNGVLGSGVPAHVAPPVPEGQPYAYANVSGEESLQGGVVKKGFKVGWTFEAWINDLVGYLQQLPELMRRVILDTQEWEVMNALLTGVTNAQQIQGGAVPTGGTVPANAPISRDALIRAIIELENRTVNGRRVRVTGGYNLIIPTGQATFVNFMLNQTLALRNTNPAAGTQEYVHQVNGYDPLAGITVIESEYIPDGEWFLVAKSFGGRPILELLQLVGHELPELRVENATGSYIGGGAPSPYEGSFANDTTDLRVRVVDHGVLWSPQAVVWSTGAGS